MLQCDPLLGMNVSHFYVKHKAVSVLLTSAIGALCFIAGGMICEALSESNSCLKHSSFSVEFYRLDPVSPPQGGER